MRLAPAHQADQHPTPIEGQQLEIIGRVASSHRVQDHIEGGEIPQCIQAIGAYHATLGPQFFAVGQALGGADTDPARTAEGLAQLDRRRADPTGPGVQQHLFPGLELRQLEQIQPGRGVDFRQRRGLDQRQSLGHRQRMARIDHHFLGHATTGQQRTDPITDFPGRTRADFTDHPGAFQPQHLAGPGRRWIQPRALQQVGPIQAGGGHANTNLARIASRAWLLNPLHMTFNALQCFHSASIVSLD